MIYLFYRFVDIVEHYIFFLSLQPDCYTILRLKSQTCLESKKMIKLKSIHFLEIPSEKLI